MNKEKILSILLILSVFIIFAMVLVNGARLPTIGGDSDLWGTILNEFLQVEHGVNGTHTNITATGLNVSGDFSVNNASGDKLLGLNDEGDVKIERGVILGNYASKPTCDATHLGMMVFDTVNNKPYVCVSGNVWNPLDSDYDSDGIVQWLDNDDTVSNDLCTTDDVGFCFINKSSKSLLDTDLISSNIKSGITIFGVAGNSNVVDTSSGDAIASNILSGKKAWVDGSEITGSISNCASEGSQDCYATGTYYAGTSKTVSSATTSQSAGYYSAFDLATVDTDLATGNIKSGVAIFGVAGNSNVVDTSSGDAIASNILSGKKAWVDGSEITGSISNCASEGSQDCYATSSYYAGTNKTISNSTALQSAGYYDAFNLSKKDANLKASNIKKGTLIYGINGTYGTMICRTCMPAPDFICTDYCTMGTDCSRSTLALGWNGYIYVVTEASNPYKIKCYESDYHGQAYCDCYMT